MKLLDRIRLTLHSAAQAVESGRQFVSSGGEGLPDTIIFRTSCQTSIRRIGCCRLSSRGADAS